MPSAMKDLRESLSPSCLTPHYIGKILAATWQNRRELSYTWKILKDGVCDGCSTGSHGLQDDVLQTTHCCIARLKFLRRNTIGPLDPASLSDVARLRGIAPQRLTSLGRLAYPLIRRKGQRGFLRISWEEAIDVIAKEIRQVTPNELAFLAGGQGLTNESYYVFQKLARALGTNNLDLCARLRRPDPLAGLRASLGFAASTCSLPDMIGTDLLVVFGSDGIRDISAATQYLRRARKAGTRVVLLNSAGMASSDQSSANDELQLVPGGEAAFIAGVLKFLVHAERVDTAFIDRQTSGFPELLSALKCLGWEQLEQRSGIAREEMQRFAELYSRSRTAVFAYSESFVSRKGNVEAVADLALARGMVGREKCGIMAIRSDDSEQGASECGIAPDYFAGGFAVREDTARRFSNLWHHPVSSRPGMNASAMIRTAYDFRIKVLYALRCDPVGTADRAAIEEALARVPVRVHQDIALNTSMLLDPLNTIVLLPSQTRYEQHTGGICTSTERRLRYTPEIPGHDIGESLADWKIPVDIARRTMSNGDKLFPFASTQTIREEMSRVMPMYLGVEQLAKRGDQLQWGGPRLYTDSFTAMPRGRALFTGLDFIRDEI